MFCILIIIKFILYYLYYIFFLLLPTGSVEVKSNDTGAGPLLFHNDCEVYPVTF